MNRKLYAGEENCCGCGACYAACPAGAITMAQDARGFLFPRLDKECCVDCGRCEKVCPMHSEGREPEEQRFYAVKHLSREVREKSQSGGLFWALAEPVLRDGGHVYGAVLAEDFSVYHKMAATLEDARAFHGSKYAQSDTRDTFREAAEDLREGIPVLYSGTPCQIEGLRRYLGPLAESPKLLLAEILCFGVGSAGIHPRLIEYVERKEGKKVVEFEFRDRQARWEQSRQSYGFADGSRQTSRYFATLYYQKIILRESCLNCPFANPRRISDITMADCWGIGRFLPDFKDDQGVSLAIVNTRRGENAFQRAGEFLETRPIGSQEAMARQPRLAGGPQRRPFPKRYQAFWRDYERLPFARLLKKNTELGGFRFKVRRKILQKSGRW